MDLCKKISWHQGMFLQPQHFQLWDSYHEAQLKALMKLTQDHFWGSENIVIDPSALQAQQLNISSGTVVFKSGTVVEIGKNAILATRSFVNSWENRSQPLKIYLGIRKITPYAANVTTVKSWQDIHSVQTRYAALEQPDEIKDSYYSGPQAFVKTQRLVLQLLWAHELPDSGDFEVIEIAQIKQNKAQIIGDSNYIPPCLSIKSNQHLHDLIKGLRDNLYARAKQLDVYKLQTATQDNIAMTRQWFNVLALQVFNRYMLAISHMLMVDRVTPARCFQLLLQLVGELTTFNQNDSLFSHSIDQNQYFIAYRHEALMEIFSEIKNTILRLCDNITFVPHQFFTLDHVDDLFVADLPGNIFTPRTSYYLRIYSEENINQLQTINFKTAFKIGASVSIKTIVERSLSGIPFEILDTSPPGVPKDDICIYCQLDSTVDQWRSIVASHSISVFWEHPIKGTKIDFITMRS